MFYTGSGCNAFATLLKKLKTPKPTILISLSGGLSVRIHLIDSMRRYNGSEATIGINFTTGCKKVSLHAVIKIVFGDCLI
jgi:hypothetical protein